MQRGHVLGMLGAYLLVAGKQLIFDDAFFLHAESFSENENQDLLTYKRFKANPVSKLCAVPFAVATTTKH